MGIRPVILEVNIHRIPLVYVNGASIRYDVSRRLNVIGFEIDAWDGNIDVNNAVIMIEMKVDWNVVIFQGRIYCPCQTAIRHCQSSGLRQSDDANRSEKGAKTHDDYKSDECIVELIFQLLQNDLIFATKYERFYRSIYTPPDNTCYYG